MAIEFELWKERAEALLPHIAISSEGLTNKQAAALIGHDVSGATAERAVQMLRAFLASGTARIDNSLDDEGYIRHRFVIDSPNAV